MRRKVRAKRAINQVRKQLHWTLEECEPRRLLSVTPVAHPILSRILAPGAYTDGNTKLIGLTAPYSGVTTPAQMRGAYGVSAITSGSQGLGQTIAIIDAYDDPNALADLQAFDAYYGLINPPSFQKLNQQGLPAPLPSTDPAGAGSPFGTWEEEESLDIEWAHVMAPQANIVLYETNDNSNVNLYQGIGAAITNANTSVVSMSFGGSEFSGETALDSYLTTPAGHKPIAFFASAGDSGAYVSGSSPPAIMPDYPASSPNVVAVGGTSLTVGPNNTYGSEIGWGNGTSSSFFGGGGGGISLYEPQPSYQQGVVTQSNTQRTYPDLALEADPNTGVAIYDSFDFGNGTGWIDGLEGGTSLSSPMMAGIISIADAARVNSGFNTLNGRSDLLPAIYANRASDFRDITTGNNGYTAGTGYDLVTGVGSPIANLLVNDLQPKAIGDTVFNDDNANGIQDDSGGGIAGITVVLHRAGADGVVGTGDDTTVATTTTNSSGQYSFTNVPTAADYYIHFSLGLNFHYSPQYAGGDSTRDSDVDPTTGNTGIFPYTAGTSITSVDCGEYTQTLSIASASVTEGNSGTTPMTFTVTLNGANNSPVTVGYTTVNGTATTGDNDYVANSGTLSFAAGVNTATITVLVVGDTKIENNELFTVVLTNPSGFGAGTLVGTGTIVNDDFPTVSVSSYSLLRPDTGTVNYPFTFTLSTTAPFEVDVPYTTQDVSAVGTVDYATTSGTLIFPAGSTTQSVSVPVYGSTTPTLDKTFEMVAESSSTVHTTSASVGIGTILSNSPPAVNITGGSVTESLTGLTYVPFYVTVAPALTGTVTVNYTTADGSAVAGTDYTPVSGTLTFTPGQIEKTVEVPFNREFVANVDKTVSLNLSNLAAPGNVTLTNAVATGTIHDLAVYTVPFSATSKGIYTDYLNNKVTVSMVGPGVGSILFLGSSSVATDAYEIAMTGTTSNTALTIKTPRKAQTTFRTIETTGSIGSITGKGVNVQGSITTSGSLNSLTLNYISASTIDVGSGNGGLNVSFGRALDTSITSAIPIRSITGGNYLNTDGVDDDITAPSVGGINVKGTFGGTIVKTSTDSISTGGTLQNASLRATDVTGSFTANSSAFSNSLIPGWTTSGDGTSTASEVVDQLSLATAD